MEETQETCSQEVLRKLLPVHFVFLHIMNFIMFQAAMAKTLKYFQTHVSDTTKEALIGIEVFYIAVLMTSIYVVLKPEPPSINGLKFYISLIGIQFCIAYTLFMFQDFPAILITISIIVHAQICICMRKLVRTQYFERLLDQDN